MLTDYLTYHPHKVKRNKNHSVDIMNALRAQNLSAETLIDKLALSNKEEDKKLYSLIRKLQNRCVDRFQTLSQAFRFFDTSQKGKISKVDF